MKNVVSLFVSLTLILSLTACGQNDFATVIVTTTQPDPPTESAPEPTVEILPTSAADTARYAFGKVLWDAYLSGILPDGTALDWTSTESASQNDFILYDVDSDGQEELLLYWGNACMAGMRLDVFGYRDGTVFTELAAFPVTTFYDNGAVTVDWSHNQGLAGIREDFWPYDLYTYDAETDTYQRIGSVDGWDYRMTSAGPPHQVFPTDIDTDGDGMVYFMLPADWDGSYSSAYLADGPEYEAWRNSYLNGAVPLIIPTQKLAEGSIAALGYPKPDVPTVEPAG